MVTYKVNREGDYVIKNFIIGLTIFLSIFIVELFKSDLGFVVNIAGGAGIFSIIVGAFLKGAFVNPAVAAIQDKDMSNFKK